MTETKRTAIKLTTIKLAAAGAIVLGVLITLAAERLASAPAWAADLGSGIALVAAAVYFVARMAERRRLSRGEDPGE